ncbi:NACHT, LRR and PYD domains-containing protein 3-like isoform X4 [Hemitrygon akajei]|uniref:NACHT, LRR and PYD domains-containing protein 3-like isoform X4 n=1 Tax=Hemitrygon akajei TaxID=2704970 RepID=UPI003BFA2A92
MGGIRSCCKPQPGHLMGREADRATKLSDSEQRHLLEGAPCQEDPVTGVKFNEETSSNRDVLEPTETFGNGVESQDVENPITTMADSANEDGDPESTKETKDTESPDVLNPIPTVDDGANQNGDQESSKERKDTDPQPMISDLMSQCEDYHLFRLTIFYRERLKPMMEEWVEGLSSLMRQEGHFTEREHEEVTKLAERGNRTESSKLFLSLVMEKGTQARRVMWESFVEMRKELPKLNKILKEIEKLGPDPYEHTNNTRGFCDLSSQLKDVQQKHKETLQTQTEKLRVNTILMREKPKDVQLDDRYTELTVISTFRDQRLVEHELLARGRDHEKWRQKHLRKELEKIRADQLFQSSFSRKSGNSAAMAGVPGIGKTTMVQKIVYDWATGRIYQQFQFVFSFRFRDLNSINSRINLRELILHQYPYFGNILREVWKNPEGLLFILDGLDEFKHQIDFADSRRDTEPKHQCPDPEWWCEVSDIVYSLIQGKLLPGCSVLVTTRPTVLHLLGKAKISVWAEILGFVGEERKKYFVKYFEDQMVAAALLKHVQENEILYTMTYNPSYCWILALTLGPFFKQIIRGPQRVPKTITQLYSYYIYNILKNHGREIENPRDVLLRVGQMAYRGVSDKKIVFTIGDFINYNLQPSQFLSGFLMELLERDESPWNMVYTFPHLTIQEFAAALAQFLNPHPGDILKFLTEAHNTSDGRFEVFLRFVAGLSNSMTAQGLEEFLGQFPCETTCRVIDWVKEEVEHQNGNTWSEAGKRSLLNTLHYLFESQNRGLAQGTLGSVKTLSFSRITLTPIDCTVLSHAIGLCDTIKCLHLENCMIQYEGIEQLGRTLHKCQELRLRGVDFTDSPNELRDSGGKQVSVALRNPVRKARTLQLCRVTDYGKELGDSGGKLVSVALRNPECKIHKLDLRLVGLTDSVAKDIASALSTNLSLTELFLGHNDLGDSAVKKVCEALKNRKSKLTVLNLNDAGLTDSVAEDIVSVVNTNPSLWELDLCDNELGDAGAKLVSAALRNPECKIQVFRLRDVCLTDSSVEDLVSALSTNPSLTVLSLNHNSLTDRSVPALRRLILSLPSLERIELGGNRFSRTREKELRSLRGVRPGLTVDLNI